MTNPGARIPPGCPEDDLGRRLASNMNVFNCLKNPRLSVLLTTEGDEQSRSTLPGRAPRYDIDVASRSPEGLNHLGALIPEGSRGVVVKKSPVGLGYNPLKRVNRTKLGS